MSEKKKYFKPLYSNIAYDDAFRTMESKCDDILIPFINYFFKEHYDKNAVISRMPNEHFLDKKNLKPKKRITDSFFSIIQNGKRKNYHIECESRTYDGSILLRLFEYDSEIAGSSSEVNADTLLVRFPHTGLFLLRDSKDAPQEATFIIETPTGKIEYKIPVMKESDFTLDEIFNNDLYLLIPFYIFNFENDFKEINSDEKKLDEMGLMIKEIISRLDDSLKEGRLSANSYHVIMNSTHSVMSKMTEKHDALQGKVGEIMGGKVLEDLDVLTFKRGKEEGIEEGIEEATSKNINKLALHLMEKEPSLSKEEALSQAKNILS